MRINSFSELDKNFNYSISIGTFDGLHLGHMKTLNKLKEFSDETKTLIIAFNIPPRFYIFNKNQKLLTTKSEKFFLLGTINSDYYILIDFNKQIKKMNQNEFLGYIGVKIDNLVVGKNFKFGNGRQDVLNLDLNVEMCDYETVDDEIVSSSLIRSLISEGNIVKANRMMGRNYYIEVKAEVIDGNIKLRTKKNKLLPPEGHYSFSIFGKEVNGVLKIEKDQTINLGNNFVGIRKGEEIKISLIDKRS